MKFHKRIRMKHGVRTKGTTIKKGELVTLVEFPVGARHYYGYCTVVQKNYGSKKTGYLHNIQVSVPKSVLHKTPLKEVYRKSWHHPPYRKRTYKKRKKKRR